jgi:hypothetical protein
MDRLNLSWGISITFPGYGGNIDCPEWETVEGKLQTVLPIAGTVTLDAEDKHEKSRSLQLRAENGKYLITLGMETEDDWVVHTYHNPAAQSPNERVEILGDFWAEQMICIDKEIVMAIFKQFFDTGDVSTTYLS